MLTTFSIPGIIILIIAVSLFIIVIHRMKKVILKNRLMKFALMIAAVAFIFYGYISLNKPLDSKGYSFHSEDSTIIVAEIENEGFAKLNLRSVTVNGNETPSEVRLGTSRSNGNPTIADWRNPAKGIQFDSIDAHTIQTPPEEKYSGEMDRIRQYAIGVEHHAPISTITVHYTYLGFPFDEVIEMSA
ncbi:hypothetical protein H0266_14200 [Halobacillus locisalis]|uniref:Uncharacterized protein n=1 Tax=Halobacillus locisalis TaxID=220753 RepID=A0A838CWA1_9BACI|nr:hypothetical protein [Halobacillus locisalis]MBA2176045.1 hypothetical protein [Halobacillus locisalis]